MIPASSFLLDGDTALWVTSSPVDAEIALSRSCDTCGGEGDYATGWDDKNDWPCPDCDGTGRHTFDIEVEWDDGQRTPPQRLRVHVIDVREILGTPSDPWVTCEDDEDPITLPPDAAPGSWLVRLAVHS